VLLHEKDEIRQQVMQTIKPYIFVSAEKTESGGIDE